jgi:hypothetical protein
MKQRNSRYLILNSIVLVLGSLCIQSCDVFVSLRQLNQKQVRAKPLLYENKQLLFVPISHIGKKIFYERLRDSVKCWKKDGFVIYYEQIIKKKLADSSKIMDTIVLKYRKMAGGLLATRNYYGDALSDINKIFGGLAVQPVYDSLGIDSMDFNADITLDAVIKEYERLYGEVILEDFDYNTPKDSVYRHEPLKNDMDAVIIDFRNRNLLKQLLESQNSKIVIIYGVRHIIDVRKELKKMEKAERKNTRLADYIRK